MQNITPAHCNNCGRRTNHDIIAAEMQEDDKHKVNGISWRDSYEMLKCLGCNSVTVRHSFGCEDTQVIYFPAAMHLRAPLWTDNILVEIGLFPIPGCVCALMREIYIAVQNDSRRLAAMGIRAALEQVMIDKVGDQGRFAANVDAFQKKGYLSTRQALVLSSILDAGHATTHRGWEPTDDHIDTLLDITESIIESVYLHQRRIRALDGDVPKRPRPWAGEAK